MINGGYAKQSKKYREFRSIREVGEAIDWAEHKGVSRSGAFWNHLMAELARLDSIKPWPNPSMSDQHLS